LSILPVAKRNLHVTSKPFAVSVYLAVLVFALSLGAATGRAQSTKSSILPVLPTTEPTPPLTPSLAAVAARKAKVAAGQMVSPFDRVIAPYIPELLKGKKLVSPSTVKPMANAVGNAGPVNFPGFVSTPYLTLHDGSPSQVDNSVTGDFNHDGKPDVAMVREDGTIDVILGPGPGIANQTPIVSNRGNPQGLEIVDVAVADMNGDGIPDLVGQDYANSQVVVWTSNGDGTFSAPHTYLSKYSNATKAAVINSMIVGDFNHDGAMDVVTLTYLNNPSAQYSYTTTIIVQTFLNNGSGALDPLPEQDTVFNDYYYQEVGNVAVTSDGVNTTGIVFLLNDQGFNNGYSAGNDIIAMASNGDGTFHPPVEPATQLIPQDAFITVYGSVVATNLTAKGPGQPTTDIVFITGDGAVWDAPFTSGNPATANVLVGADYWPAIFDGLGQSPPTSVNNAPEFWQTSVSIADMNNDGLQDLVVYLTNGIVIYTNAGNGVFSATPTQMESDQGLVRQAQPADYAGSGYNSLVDVDYYLGQVGYIQNLGAAGSPETGQFVSAIVPTGINRTNQNAELLGSNFQVLATADINGDGILDVIGLDISNNQSLLATIVVGLSNGSAPGNQTSNYTFTTVNNPNLGFPNTHGIGYVEPVTISNTAGTSILIVNNYAGGPYLYLNPVAKNGAAGAPQDLDFGTAGVAILQNCLLSRADTGDVNGDGTPDIVIACGGTGNTASGFFTFLGNPDGTFQTATFTPLGKSLYMVKLINLTGVAGKLDLAAFDYDLSNTNNPALDVYVVPNKGDGSGSFDLARYSRPVTNYALTDIVVGDYNADGKQDLTLLTLGHWDPLILNTDPNTSGVLLLPGNGDYTFGNPTLVATNTNPISGAYADFNGDGFPDLAMNVLANVTPYSYEYAPLAQVLPNLGGGNFGPPIVQFHAVTDPDYVNQTTFVGPFTKSGGPDLLIGSRYGAALYVNRGVTTTNLAASSASPGQGVAVTFTATLSQVVNAGAAPTGTVSFTSNGMLLGSATPNQGVATLTVESLPVGADTVTATFAGDANHNQSSASISITVVPVTPSFALSSTTPTLSLTQGSNGSVLVTVAANPTFNGVVQLTCTGAPAEVSCTPSPVSVTLSPGQSSIAPIFIVTTPPNNTTQASNSPIAGTLGGITLSGLVFMLWPGRRRLPRVLSVLAFAALVLTSFGALSGCGGSGNKYPGTVAGSYNLVVTGVSGGITQTQTITLTVSLPPH
jgi:hypothetical protein